MKTFSNIYFNFMLPFLCFYKSHQIFILQEFKLKAHISSDKMPKHLQKSLQDYLSKIKIHNPNNHQSSSFQPTKVWILSGCKHPKTISYRNQKNHNTGNNNNKNGAAATLSDVDRFLYENFKSLYIKEDHEEYYSVKGSEYRHHPEANNNCSPIGILFGSPRFLEPPPDLSGSHRFFVSPGLCESLMEEARSCLTATSDDLGSGSSSRMSNFLKSFCSVT